MDESELDELLQRAIDPYVPVELFYAVLDRIGGPYAAAPESAGVGPAGLPASTSALPGPEPEFTYGLELDTAPRPDATVLMEQVEQLEAAMAGE